MTTANTPKSAARLSTLALATMAAGLYLSAGAAFADDAKTTMMKCEHASSCKGHGACKTASNACKGQNACKGMGMTMEKSAEDCTAAQMQVKKP